ncbi:MAG: hypothetical protein LAP86_17485 [Acidobacteriia bacterium]|nr:hypothetical protein [Terriglobia bacterium]
MTTIRKFVYAALLAATAMNFAPSLAAAQEPAHGKFTLKHNVNWGNAVVPAGDYEFAYDPYQSSPVLTLSKLSGKRAGFMLLVTNSEDSKPSDSNQLLLETTADGSYVSAMELAECGMTLHFSVPAHALKQMAKAVPPAAPSGQ